jgi:hypothetical protein
VAWPRALFFVTTPEDCDAFLHDHLADLTYGWGVIPARVRIGETEVETSLMPRDGVYLVPLKVALRRPGTSTRSNVVGYPTPRSNVVGYPTPRFSQLSSPVSPPPR